MIKKQLINEQGLSLVEVIAASGLIIIVLISFFSFFISSKNTNIESKNTVSTTYIAQNEMENIYKQIQNTTNQESMMIEILKYSQPCIDGSSKKYLKTSTKQHAVIVTKITPNIAQTNLVNILISIYDIKDVPISNACAAIPHQPKSQMENIVKAGGF